MDQRNTCCKRIALIALFVLTLSPGIGHAQSEPRVTGLLPQQKQQIEETLTAWTTAWSDQNVEAFLSFYAPEFRVPSGHTRQSWEQYQRQQIKTPTFIRVMIGNIEVDRNNSTVRVRFTQIYRSNARYDQTDKGLFFKWTNMGWKIVAEEDRSDSHASGSAIAVTTPAPPPISVEAESSGTVLPPESPTSPKSESQNPEPMPSESLSSRVQTDAAIQMVVQKNRSAIMYYYQQQLKFYPQLQGLIKMRLKIQPDGLVGKAEILVDTVNHSPLTRFIETRARAWQFGPMDRTETVELTFPFFPP